MYYVTITARQKRARRHISGRYNTLEEARRNTWFLSNRYIVGIYTGNWSLVEEIDRKAAAK